MSEREHILNYRIGDVVQLYDNDSDEKFLVQKVADHPNIIAMCLDLLNESGHRKYVNSDRVKKNLGWIKKVTYEV